MRLEQLKYIVEIYHTHSLSQAAKNLSLSQPSLSNALAALEDEWDLKLFHRLATGVIPTEDGERLIPQIALALNELNRLATVRPKPSAFESIQFMAAPAICSGLLPPTIAAFQRQYPHISITVLEVRPEYLLRTLAAAPGYLGISAYDSSIDTLYRSQAESLDFVIEYLYVDQFICCAPPQSPICQQTHLSRDKLKEYTAINYSSLIFGDLDPASDEAPQFPYELYQGANAIGVDNLESLKKLIAAGAGVTVVPRSALYQDAYLNAGLLAALPFEDGQVQFYHHLLFPQKHMLSPVETAFLSQLRQTYAEMEHYFASHPL